MTYEDLSEDLAQLARLRMQRRFREARFVLDELRRAFEGHPDLGKGKTRSGLPTVAAVARRNTMSIVVASPLTKPKPPRRRRRAA